MQKLSAKRGARDRLRLLRGHRPQGISKGKPLRHAFRIFPRERKDTAVWSAELHEGKVCRNLILGQCVKCFRFFPTLKFYQTFCFVGLRTPLPRLLSCVKKVGKDTQGTFWFLDLRQREGVAPSRLPQWRIELVEILRGNETKL